MSEFTLDGFSLDLKHNSRVNEIFDAYRVKLTGSLECKNNNSGTYGLYDFIYRKQPGHLTEILMIMYQIGYEDGCKDVARQAGPLFARDEQDCVGIDLSNPASGDVNLRLVVDNTRNRPDPDPDPPANVAMGILAA